MRLRRVLFALAALVLIGRGAVALAQDITGGAAAQRSFANGAVDFSSGAPRIRQPVVRHGTTDQRGLVMFEVSASGNHPLINPETGQSVGVEPSGAQWTNLGNCRDLLKTLTIAYCGAGSSPCANLVN